MAYGKIANTSSALGPRLAELDALRGIAAVSVAFYHFIMLLDQRSLRSGWQLAVAHTIGDHYIDLGKAGVFTFFLISGFVIPATIKPGKQGIIRFIAGRFFRLYPLYWFALALGLLVANLKGLSYDLSTVLANTTMLQGYLGQPDVVHVFWTLQVEMTFYFICSVLSYFGLLGAMRSLVAMSFLFAGIAVLGAFIAVATHHRFPLTMPLALSLMFFGALWHQATLKGPSTARFYGRRVLPILVTMIAVACVNYREDTLSYIGCYAIALTTFIKGMTLLRGAGSTLVRLGQISYSIYLMHGFVAVMYLDYLGLGAFISQCGPVVTFVILFAATYVVSNATFNIIEVPCIRYGKKAIRGRQALSGASA